MGTEYISWEAAIEELRKSVDCANCNGRGSGACGFCSINDTVRLIKGIPAADVEPVVRCEEREHYRPDYPYDAVCVAPNGLRYPGEGDGCKHGRRKDQTAEVRKMDGQFAGGGKKSSRWVSRVEIGEERESKKHD